MISRLLRIAVIALLGLMLWFDSAFAVEVGVVRVSNLNVRSGPGKGYRVIMRLAEQSRVRVLGREKGWLKIDHAGTRGYILENKRFIRLTAIDESAGSSVDAAQGIEPSELKELQIEAETVKEKLDASRRLLDEVTRKEQAMIDEIHASERALDRQRRQVRAARQELEALHARTEEINASFRALEREVAENEAYAARRLKALYKLNWIGRVQLLATAGSFYDFIQRKTYLERILSQDEAVLDKLRADQTALASLLEQLNSKRAEKKALEIELSRRIAILDREQQKRTALLNKIRDRKELELAAFKSLHQSAKALDSTLASFQPGETGALAPKANRGVDGNLPFEKHKGLLSWPVRGKIISFFGPYRDEKANLVNFQSGINIRAERGEPVRAVSGGYAIYSSWFKGFGNMLIIDHGKHYYTVYAHLEEVFKVKGDRIDKDEVIATVGDSGSLMGPALHFEIRHHGKPIDPLEWIDKG